MTETRTSKDSATNYDVQTTLTADGGGEQVEVTLTHTVTQESIILTDETFTYNFTPSTSGFVSFINETRPKLLDAAASRVADSLPSAPTSAVEDYIAREAPPGGRAAVRPLLTAAEGTFSMSVQTQNKNVPGQFSNSASVTFRHPLTVPVTEDVSDSERERIRESISDVAEPTLSFSTEPRNEAGDIIPEFTASTTETEVSVPARELITFVEVSTDPVTPSISLASFSGFPDSVEPDTPLEATLSLEDTNGYGGEYVVNGPGGVEKTVNVPASGPTRVPFTFTPGSFDPGGVAIFTVRNPNTDEQVVETRYRLPDVADAVSELGFSVGDIPDARLPDEGLQLPLTVENVGDAATTAQVLVNGTEVQRVDIGPSTSTTPEVSAPASVLTSPPEVRVTVRNTSTGNELTKTVQVPVSPPTTEGPELSPLAPGDIEVGLTPPDSPPEPGAVFPVEYTVENVRDSRSGEFTLLAGGDLRTVSLPPGEAITGTISTTAPRTGSAPVEVTVRQGSEVVASVSDSVPVERPPDPTEEEVETPDPPSFDIRDVDVPSAPLANERFDVGLVVENTGGETGDVRINGPQGRETFTISPGGTRTYTGDGIVVDSPGQFTRTFTIENETTGDTFAREVGGSVGEQPSLVSPPDEILGRTTAWPVGNDDFSSGVRMEVDSAQTDGEQTTVEVTFINRPRRGAGFFVDMVTEVAVGGENARREVSTSPGFDGRPGETTETFTLDAVAATGEAAFYPTYADEPSDIRDEVRGGVAETSFPIAPPPAPEFALADIRLPSAVGIGTEYTPELDIENVGGSPGEVEVAGPGVSESAEIAPGEVETFTATTTNQSQRPKVLDYRIENVSESTTSTVSRTVGTQVPSFAISELAVPDSTPFGEPFQVALTVVNTGTVPGDAEVSLPGVTETVTVAPGEEQTVTATGLEPATTAGRSITTSVTNPVTGDTQQRRETVTTDAPSFDFTALRLPEEPPVAESVTGEVDVTNTGTAPGRYEVRTPSGVADGELSPGRTETVTFQVQASTTEPQDVQASGENLTVGESFGTASETLTPTAPEFRTTLLDAPEEPPLGTDATIAARVTNAGEAPGEYEVTANNATRRGRLAPGESDTVQFVVPTRSREEREVSIDGTNLTAGESFSGESVTFTPAAPALSITSVTPPESVALDDRATVEVGVENTGNAVGQFEVELAGETQSGRLRPGETTTVAAPVTVDSVQGETFTAVLRNSESGDRADTRQFSLTPAAPQFAITGFAVPDTVPPGEPVSASVSIEEQAGNPGVARVQVPEANARERVQLPANGSRRVTVQAPSPTGRVTQLTATVDWVGSGRQMDRATASVSRDEPQPDPAPPEPPRPDPAPQPAPEPELPDRPSIIIRSVDAPDEVPAGDTYTVRVRVANTGDAGTRLLVTAGGTTQEVQLPAGRDRVVTLDRRQPTGGTPALSVTAQSVLYPSERDARTVSVGAPEPVATPPTPDTPGEGDETFIEALLDFFFPGVE